MFSIKRNFAREKLGQIRKINRKPRNQGKLGKIRKTEKSKIVQVELKIFLKGLNFDA